MWIFRKIQYRRLPAYYLLYVSKVRSKQCVPVLMCVWPTPQEMDHKYRINLP
jgi:hypothetical protein